MRRVISLACRMVAGMSVLASVPVLAHHSFAAAYDENRPLNMHGVVTKV